MKFACPLPAALTTIPVDACPFRFDQMVRMAFQRRQSAAPFSGTTVKVIATWTPLLAATDATKIVPSPIFAGMTIPSSEGNSTGGNDNSTFNGVPEYYGENAVLVTGQFKNLSPTTITAMRLLSQESVANAVGVSSLTAFFFNKDGVGFYGSDFKGVPIYNFRLGTMGSEGLNAANVSPFSFVLPAYWDEKIASFVPTDFDPLTQL